MNELSELRMEGTVRNELWIRSSSVFLTRTLRRGLSKLGRTENFALNTRKGQMKKNKTSLKWLSRRLSCAPFVRNHGSKPQPRDLNDGFC
jgi:hypothetical protein